jgi:hypothetical protein
VNRSQKREERNFTAENAKNAEGLESANKNEFLTFLASERETRA